MIGDRADRHAGPTIDALYGIDVELRDLIEARTASSYAVFFFGWMQSTGQASTRMQGSAITKAIGHLRLSEPTVRPRGEEVKREALRVRAVEVGDIALQCLPNRLFAPTRRGSGSSPVGIH